MALLKREERACYLEHRYLAFAFKIFASLHVVNLLSYYLAYLKLDSLNDVTLAKFSSLQIT